MNKELWQLRGRLQRASGKTVRYTGNSHTPPRRAHKEIRDTYTQETAEVTDVDLAVGFSAAEIHTGLRRPKSERPDGGRV